MTLYERLLGASGRQFFGLSRYMTTLKNTLGLRVCA